MRIDAQESRKTESPLRTGSSQASTRNAVARIDRLEVRESRRSSDTVQVSAESKERSSGSGVSALLSGLSANFGGADKASAPDPLKPSADGWKTVKQGGIGDCYFLSGMVDVARKDPQAIRDLIDRNDDGSYTVRFHGSDPIRVDGKGLENGVQAEGDWAEILEQAWETRQGNVDGHKADDFGSSGSAQALEALTGRDFGERSGNLLQTELSQDNLDDVAHALREGKEVTAATGGISSLWQGPKNGVVDKHVYSVLDVDKDGNFLIRNPWGHDNGQGDGMRWMTPEEFKESFKVVTVPGDSDLQGKAGQALFTVAREGKHLVEDVVETTGEVVDQGAGLVKKGWETLTGWFS